ncbi:hypothetical protein [Streptomyces sp. RTd22]|uniref:hypothetical protein n=1 Tax=Streptomyces sp. RTd22 TaxID=1841249 RepID=UPI0007C46BB4|nr:hypothetical protein [Streptomyces sp. RTd22]
MTSPTVRAVVIAESLADGRLPKEFADREDRRYPHQLDEHTPIEIIELTVPADQAPALALALSKALAPRLYYAHLLDEGQMLVAFPNTVVHIDRGNNNAVAHAQTIGALFGIPLEQMRFAEMWDTDHPDSPTRPGVEAR